MTLQFVHSETTTKDNDDDDDNKGENDDNDSEGVIHILGHPDGSTQGFIFFSLCLIGSYWRIIASRRFRPTTTPVL
jgi:hypothetical protein